MEWKKPLAHDVVVFCSWFTHSQSNMCSEQPLTSVLGELLNHWQQFQRLQRAIAVLQVETIQDSERSNFYNFTLSKK